MSKDIKKPNFFIIGAPKCGTTAMSEYLREHPDVYFSEPKEPFYFCTDFSKEYRGFLNENDYLNLFSGASLYKAVGEGSTMYLFSHEAVPNILKLNPRAKFIVMLRDPISKAQSGHGHKLRKNRETIKDFEQAWRLQEERRKSKKIPKGCKDKKILMYGEICKLGEQVERLYRVVPKDQVLIIFFEDFKKDPELEYQRVLNFLELSDDGRVDFPVFNKRKRIGSRTLQKVINRLGNLKERLGIKKGMGILKSLKRKNVTEVEPPSLSKEFKQELVDYFNQDIDKLAKLTGRDLSHWKEI